MTDKVDYVRARAAGPINGHHCHWPGCDKHVPPAMWGCKPHWFRLPASIRRRIWSAFKPAQEISKRPSAEYVDAARDAQAWIAANSPITPPSADLFADLRKD